MPQPAASPDLLHAILAASLTGYIFFRPRYDPADPAALTDLAYVHLNPAAQRMLRLPECPAESFLTLYPNAVDTGIFAFYRDTFLAGEPGRLDVNFQHDGLDNFFQLSAHRADELLVVSFSDTADQPRTGVETALRESQARERAARAEAEQQRQRFYEVLMQLPAYVAVYQGPDHVNQFVNPPYQRLFPHRAFPGRPFREAMAEAEGLGVVALFDQVYQSGEPFYGYEMEGWFDFEDTGKPQQLFFNLCLHPLRDAQGRIDGMLNFSYDVTEQVRARQQVQQLNQELEARVFERTQALRHAEAEAVSAAQRLRRITESLPSTSFTTDPTGQVRYISPQWYAYTGMAPGAPISEVWPTLIHPDDLPSVAREFGAALVEGRPWGYEFRLRGADGQYRWFASQGVPEPLAEAEAAGRPRQWFGSNLDIDDLKQAQHAQQQQEQLLTTILTALPAGVATFAGEDLRYTFFNDTFQQRVQGRAEVGRTVAELFPEAQEQGYLDLLHGVLRTAEPYHAHEAPAFVQDPRTGERLEMYLDLAYLPLRHGQEPPHAVLAFSVVVTERVHTRRRAEAAQAQLLAAAEQAATQREAFYRVFEQTPACIALLRDPDHRFEYVNPAYCALFPERPLLGRTMAEAFPETAEQGYLALLDRVYQTSETYFGQEVKFTAAPAAGQPPQDTYYDITYQAIREGDQTVGISVFAFNVTERIRARQEREAHRQQLERLFMQAPAAIAILGGPGLVYELVNPVYASLFPGRELPGRAIAAVFPELAGTGVVETFERVYHTGISNEESSLLIPFTNPATGQLEDRYFNYIQQARFDAHGHPDGVLAFGFEVTEQVRARQQAQALAAELTTANQQLVRTNVDLDTFVYTASHDLKAPISNLDGLLTLLREELPAEVAQGEYVAPTLAHMRDAVERFKRTIDHLTEVSKLQKEHEPALAPVDLAAVVEDVRQDLAPLLRANNAQLTVAVANFPAIFFSEKNLRSVVYNLLSNALKYRHPDRRPHIDVQAHVRAGHTVLEVHDNGLGLEPAQVARLFTMFQRFHPHIEGTGIGLFMVKRMVENAGGRIEVHSQPGAGTTFFVYLPHAPSV